MSEHNSLSAEYPYEIAEGWFDKGQNEETVFKFISYWIVFNHLYNYGLIDIDEKRERKRIEEFCKNNMETLVQTIDFSKLDLSAFLDKPVISGSKIIKGIDGFTSRDSIIERVKDSIYKPDPKEGKLLDKALKDNALKDKILKEKALKEKDLKEKAERIADDYLNIRGSDIEKKILSLFNEIYTVRCNLFHGSKMPIENYERDYNLVAESAAVLELCLPELVFNTFGRRIRER